MLTGAFVGPVFAPSQEETPILRLVWLPVFAIIAGLALRRLDRIVRAWPAILLLGLTVLLAFASKWWSIDAATTQRRVIALTMAGAFALYLGSVYRGVALPRLLACAGLVMAVGSLVFVLAFPPIGIHRDVNVGLWRGMWYEKNQMGQVMVCVAVAAAAWLSVAGRHWRIAAITLVLATFLMIMSQSKTSLLCWLIGFGLVGAVWAARQGGAVLGVLTVWGATFAAIAVGVGFLLGGPAILVALGKDPSLTGRTEIWAALMDMVAERPWTGYGYAAFWTRTSVPADIIQAQTGWLVPSAHNGWIDLLVQVGWPGAVLVGTILLIGFAATVARLSTSGLVEGGFSLAYLAIVATLSLSESVLLHHQDLAWVMVLAIVARSTMLQGYPSPAAVAPDRRPAYQTPSRIAALSGHGQARRKSVPVRPALGGAFRPGG
ncbi:O-antigen ligase family protein [Brevundimonas sp.]|uniref:O-antigen ligase family protein n=1 Tax=Brevundimonas sp. TaxID=1871086 RepID=UPI0022C80128|nr:O-antigen ligase family protein [Brevundimonas sp.]MCZ8193782.1 O-antigen ligase family protein [Brevundimonas sp.]